MRIILIIASTLTACLSAFATLFAFQMLHGGGLGRSSQEDVSLAAVYTLLNLAVLLSLVIRDTTWKPVFYMLGIMDFGCGVSIIIPKVTYPALVLFGLTLCFNGALTMSYPSRMAATTPQ